MWQHKRKLVEYDALNCNGAWICYEKESAIIRGMLWEEKGKESWKVSCALKLKNKRGEQGCYSVNNTMWCIKVLRNLVTISGQNSWSYPSLSLHYNHQKTYLILTLTFRHLVEYYIKGKPMVISCYIWILCESERKDTLLPMFEKYAILVSDYGYYIVRHTWLMSFG